MILSYAWMFKQVKSFNICSIPALYKFQFVIFAMTSGQMWNHIRGPPVMHKNPSTGQIVCKKKLSGVKNFFLLLTKFKNDKFLRFLFSKSVFANQIFNKFEQRSKHFCIYFIKIYMVFMIINSVIPFLCMMKITVNWY